MFNHLKRTTRQRLEYIELVAYYMGLITRSGLAEAFSISDAAATKDLKLYNDIASKNLVYKHNVFGFIPTDSFKQTFSDLSPSTVLPIIEANRGISGNQNNIISKISVGSLIVPNRLPDKSILSQITRAIYNKCKLNVCYYSLSKNASKIRTIEPHSLANTGSRWHVRAYNESSFDFRDFVLSRFEDAKCLDEKAESNIAYDDDWVETISLKLMPHPKLEIINQESILIDYKAENGIITIKIQRALAGYLLQQLSVDTTKNHSLNPNRYQLIVVNRNEVEPFISWVFNDL